MIDFSKHIVLETHYKDDNTKHNLDIWDLKLPDSDYTHRVRFINSCGTLTVNGDFGNWVFCREFHPSNDDYASPGYWDEKLVISSVQEAKKFDSKETFKEIEYYKEQYVNENTSQEELDWLEQLVYYSDDQVEYEYNAYREKPSDIDYDYIPYGKKRHIWLEIVYEAFNELCKRMKDDSNNDI